MGNERIAVFIADDHQIVVEGIVALVSKDPAIEVVGSCNDGLQVLDMVQALQPDVLILDISLPGLNGLDACCLVKAKMPHVAVLMFSMNANERFIVHTLENGASGYLTKDGGGVEICEAIHSIVRGELYLGRALPQSILAGIKRRERDPEESVTERERHVLQLLAQGKSDQQIAAAIGAPSGEVAVCCESLRQKLGLNSQVDLIKHAIRSCAA